MRKTWPNTRGASSASGVEDDGPGLGAQAAQLPREVFELAGKVFGHSGGTVEADEIVRQCPSFVQDLGVTVLDENDAVVSFAEAWLDSETNVAEFEPVGTIPSHQKLGLGSAVMREVLGYRRAGQQQGWQAPGR